METVLHPEAEQRVPGGMELHLVDAPARPVVRPQHGRMLVRQESPGDRLPPPHHRPERRTRSSAQPPPSRASASRSAASEVNRFTSSKGGAWLKTSCVAWEPAVA